MIGSEMGDEKMQAFIDKKISKMQAAFDRKVRDVKPFVFDQACEFIKEQSKFVT